MDIDEENAVFNDFDFQPNELLSSTNTVTIFKAVLNSSVRFDENDATF